VIVFLRDGSMMVTKVDAKTFVGIIHIAILLTKATNERSIT
jgi:topoisomerase-4 subunit A